ncbi:MAG: carbon storage regulator [Chromatiales bacterium]|nr:carbon storage regulator [Chromatiales bacterium]
MLILTRRPGESLRIEPDGLVPAEADPFGWFAEGPIRIAVSAVHRDQVRIGIQAPPALKILRDELPGRPAEPVPAPRRRGRRWGGRSRFCGFCGAGRWRASARVAGLPVATVREIEGGRGLVELGEIEMLARAFGVTLPALLVPPGGTEAERVILALLEGEGVIAPGRPLLQVCAEWCGAGGVGASVGKRDGSRCGFVGLCFANPTCMTLGRWCWRRGVDRGQRPLPQVRVERCLDGAGLAAEGVAGANFKRTRR